MGTDALTHAGAAVWREAADGPAFLLVTAKGTTDQWVLPKGHIESGESPEQAARREVLEETGLHVHVGEYLGTETFISRSSRVACAYYLAQCSQTAEPATEGRAVIWLPLVEAIERATFPAGRNTLERARSALSVER